MRSHLVKLRWIGVLLITYLASGCSEDPTQPGESIVISGSVSGSALSANARVLAAWIVADASPEFLYVFGEGSIDSAAGTFEFRLDRPPPPEGLLVGGIGIGYIIVTSNQTATAGTFLSSVPEGELLGAAPQHAIIYRSTEAQVTDWLAAFPSGLSIGEGVDLPGAFDGYVPSAVDEVEIIIADWASLSWVNWH
jgi:hypothetical protein